MTTATNGLIDKSALRIESIPVQDQTLQYQPNLSVGYADFVSYESRYGRYLSTR